MSSPEFEAFLARLYTDPEARARFLNNRTAEAQAASLTQDQIASLEKLDADALEAAATSFTRKRQHKSRPRRSLLQRIYKLLKT